MKNIPTIPDDFKDLKIEGQWATTLNGERFLLKHTKEREGKDALIFCSKNGLEILAKSKRWHSDGTFKSSPDMFYQHYLLHGYYKSVMFPGAFVLMADKSKESYKLVLDELKSAAFELNLELKVELNFFIN